MSCTWTTPVPWTTSLIATIDIVANAPLRLRVTARLKLPIVCALLLTTQVLRLHLHIRRLIDTLPNVLLVDRSLAVVAHWLAAVARPLAVIDH